MLLIDDKGRLFSKINLFDLLVIIFLCLILGFGFSKIVKRYFIKKQYDSYLMQIKSNNLEEIVANSIKSGEIIVTPTGSKFGEILKITKIEATQVVVTTPDGVLVSRTQPKLKDAYFDILIQVPKGSNEIKYGNQTFKTGTTGFIETNFAKYPIQILSIEKYENKTK
jgi:hypothetical protein